MSLSKYTQARLVVQRPEATAHAAARAMEDNHIGAVIVHDGEEVVGMVTDRDLAIAVTAADRDPFEVQVRDIMSSPAVVLPPTANETDAARLMLSNHVRRIPLVDGTRVVGLVTLDDLVLEQSLDGATLASIIRAQLSDAARLKRKGAIGPEERLGDGAARRQRIAARHDARAERSYAELVRRTRELTGLPSPHSAECALEEVLSGIVRRILPEEARQLLAQIPSLLAERLASQTDGPDLQVTRGRMEHTIAYLLSVEPERAEQIVRQVACAIEQSISAGEIADVRAQLPPELRDLFSAPVETR
ncbi:MAG: CBS domain-containing protein [Deltaproteobacteria bacterium]